MIKRTAAVMLLACATLASPSRAADQEEVRTLTGLPGVYVTVQDINPAAQAFGLQPDKIRGEIELKRGIGAKIGEAQAQNRRPPHPLDKLTGNGAAHTRIGMST